MNSADAAWSGVKGLPALHVPLQWTYFSRECDYRRSFATNKNEWELVFELSFLKTKV